MKPILLILIMMLLTTASIGAQHISHIETTRSWHYVYDDKGEQDAAMTCDKEMNNCGGYCDFDGFALPPDFPRQLLNAATGFDLSPEEYATAGKRIWFMRQAFNIREGHLRDYWNRVPWRNCTPAINGEHTESQPSTIVTFL